MTLVPFNFTSVQSREDRLQCCQCLYLNTGIQSWAPAGYDLPKVIETLKLELPDSLSSVSGISRIILEKLFCFVFSMCFRTSF